MEHVHLFQISRSGMKNHLFWSEIGSGFWEPCGTPPSKIFGSTPLGSRMCFRVNRNGTPATDNSKISEWFFFYTSVICTWPSCERFLCAANTAARLTSGAEPKNSILMTSICPEFRHRFRLAKLATTLLKNINSPLSYSNKNYYGNHTRSGVEQPFGNDVSAQIDGIFSARIADASLGGLRRNSTWGRCTNLVPRALRLYGRLTLPKSWTD